VYSLLATWPELRCWRPRRWEDVLSAGPRHPARPCHRSQ